ncbi:MAG: alpha-L-fucosidase, partial [Tepidisphaeraceae bacterium]
MPKLPFAKALISFASALACMASLAVAADRYTFAAATAAARQFDQKELPTTPGRFQPTWDSLKQYQVPEWFREAKFGIWAHWGPQCEPEQGDWYGQRMYLSIDPKTGKPSPDYLYHVNHYGPPSVFGFKDVINEWHAENWDPARLMALYKRAGAKYFMAMGNHHDNMDLWASQGQPWNATLVGPKKDLIAGWEQAAHAQGMRFGVSIHAGRTWSWYEPAQGSDPDGPNKGVPYDGKVTATDGAGKWWDGLDPQDLYAQSHAIGAPADAAFCIKFFNRVEDLISNYKPDLVYFDDAVLPLNKSPGNYGLKIIADFYNRSAQWHDGRNEAVVTTKHLQGDQRKCLVYDIERGKSEGILPQPWQTDTCIGGWHYKRSIFEKHGYKKADDVIRMLIDIVSKNGNLMLNIPVRGDGTIDSDEEAVLTRIGDWMSVNGEAIFATQPWAAFGEGPSMDAKNAAKGRFGGLADITKFSAQDVRYTQSKDGKTVFAFLMGAPRSNSVT